MNNKKINRIISGVRIKHIPIRYVYDKSANYLYSGNPPIKINEDNISRCMVNHIRHNYTNYDTQLKHIYRLTRGEHNSIEYCRFKNAVLDKIRNEYKYLSDECERQKIYVNMCSKVK